MPFQMKISKDKVEGREVPPAGIYEVKLISFKPKFSKEAKTLNLNARMEIVNHPEHDGAAIYEGLNENAGWIMQDFSHAFGLPMETDGDSYWLQGTWDSNPNFDQTKAETYSYQGPLVGRVGKVEIYHDSYNNKPVARVRRYFCAVDNCDTKFPEIRHSEDLSRKAS